MSLIAATNLGKSYDPVDIFLGLNFAIPRRGRIGLVGANGVGKTTLLRILVGMEEPSQGFIQQARNLRIGYLPQEASFESGRSLWEECLAAFGDLRERQQEMADLEHRLSTALPEETEELLDAYGRLQSKFEHSGGYTYEVRIRQVLQGLGFSRHDENRPMTQLSGGQRTRAYLAKLLLQDPDLLLLDEPTNHLDIEAIEWLENYLKEWDGSVLIVSHDRYFLDQVATVTWEMTPGLEVYRGNYSAYLTQREERYARQLEEFQSQAEFIEKEQDYIRRNIAGQNTRQAQGRRKRLERLLEEARLTPPHLRRKLHLKLDSGGRSGDLVIRTYGLQVGYHDEGKPLFHCPDLVLRRGECAAVIGPNGAGKTTFLKTLLEQIPPYRGEASLGASLNIGYFAQAHEGLHPQNTLIEEINLVAPQMLPGEVRDYLAKFLFTGDDVFKPIEVLSGGERGRLALACLALSGSNLLLLDEPTNHLDLPSQEILQSVLGDYRGTILLVSHDRYLIDALATQVWEVVPAERSLRVFEGTYSEYKAWRQAEAQKAAALAAAHPSVAEKPRETRSNGLSKFEQQRRQKKLDALEAEISQIETELGLVSSQLENPGGDVGRIQKLGQDYNRLQQALEERMAEWEKLAGE